MHLRVEADCELGVVNVAGAPSWPRAAGHGVHVGTEVCSSNPARATPCPSLSRGLEASSALVVSVAEAGPVSAVPGAGAGAEEWSLGVLAGRAGVGPSRPAADGERVRGFLADVGTRSAADEVFVLKRFRPGVVSCGFVRVEWSASAREGVRAVGVRERAGGFVAVVLGFWRTPGGALGLPVGVGTGLGLGRDSGAVPPVALKRATSSICFGPPSVARTVFHSASGTLRSGIFRRSVMRFCREES